MKKMRVKSVVKRLPRLDSRRTCNGTAGFTLCGRTAWKNGSLLGEQDGHSGGLQFPRRAELAKRISDCSRAGKLRGTGKGDFPKTK